MQIKTVVVEDNGEKVDLEKEGEERWKEGRKEGRERKSANGVKGRL
jgi:hypothetical protein